MRTMFGPRGDSGIVTDVPVVQEPKPASQVAPPAPETETPLPGAALAPAAAAPAPAKQPAKPKVAKPKATPRASQPPPTDDDERDAMLARAGARGAAEALNATGRQANDDIPVHVELSEDEQERINVMMMMGRKDPKQADLADRTIKFWQEEEAYKNKWQKANPDKKFNIDDEEHAEWYEKHEPQFDEREYKRAEKALDKERQDNRLREHELRLKADIEESQRMQSEEGQLKAISDSAIGALIGLVDPELEAVVKVGDKVVVSEETWAKIAESSPTTARVLRREADFLGRKILELERLDRYPGVYHPNEKNPLHVAIIQLALRKEDEILKLPPEKQKFNGRDFIDQARFDQKINKIREDRTLSVKEKQQKMQAVGARYWTLSSAHVKQFLIGEARARATKKIAEFREVIAEEEKVRSRKAGNSPQPGQGQSPGAGSQQQPAQPPAAQPQPAAQQQRRAAPSTVTSADRMPGAGGANGSGKISTEDHLRTAGIL